MTSNLHCSEKEQRKKRSVMGFLYKRSRSHRFLEMFFHLTQTRPSHPHRVFNKELKTRWQSQGCAFPTRPVMMGGDKDKNRPCFCSETDRCVPVASDVR